MPRTRTTPSRGKRLYEIALLALGAIGLVAAAASLRLAHCWCSNPHCERGQVAAFINSMHLGGVGLSLVLPVLWTWLGRSREHRGYGMPSTARVCMALVGVGPLALMIQTCAIAECTPRIEWPLFVVLGMAVAGMIPLLLGFLGNKLAKVFVLEACARVRCPFCHDSFALGEAWLCPACSTPHHSDCAEQHGRCTVLGCASLVRT